MNDRVFPLRVVLTATTKRLVTESKGGRGNGIGDLYELLNHMTGDNLFTHQLPRASRECCPWLIRWFPELKPTLTAGGKLDEWLAKSPTCPQEGIIMWLAELRMMFPKIKDEYIIGQIPQDDHDRKDPYDELVQMRGTDEGIVLLNMPSIAPADDEDEP